MPVQKHLRPRESIPRSLRTKGKDDCFEQLETMREEGRFHDRTYNSLADETGWSRQHVKNVIEDYYVTMNETTDETDIAPNHLEINIPSDVDKECYLRGWIAGYTYQRQE